MLIVIPITILNSVYLQKSSRYKANCENYIILNKEENLIPHAPFSATEQGSAKIENYSSFSVQP